MLRRLALIVASLSFMTVGCTHSDGGGGSSQNLTGAKWLQQRIKDSNGERVADADGFMNSSSSDTVTKQRVVLQFDGSNVVFTEWTTSSDSPGTFKIPYTVSGNQLTGNPGGSPMKGTYRIDGNRLSIVSEGVEVNYVKISDDQFNKYLAGKTPKGEVLNGSDQKPNYFSYNAKAVINQKESKFSYQSPAEGATCSLDDNGTLFVSSGDDSQYGRFLLTQFSIDKNQNMTDPKVINAKNPQQPSTGNIFSSKTSVDSKVTTLSGTSTTGCIVTYLYADHYLNLYFSCNDIRTQLGDDSGTSLVTGYFGCRLP